jgi:hypothetical protein
MRYLRLLALAGICLFSAQYAHAQRVWVGFGGGPVYGPAPVCSYGYYGYYPYECAPYGYYGPDWFYSGVFIGAGPWYNGFYGGRGFYGRGGFGRGFVGRGPGFVGRGGFGNRGGFRGGGSFRGGGGSRSGGGGHR